MEQTLQTAAQQGMSVYAADVAQAMQARTAGRQPVALVRTYGCQQNVADSEKLRGLLAQMGFAFTEDEDGADLILFNTCAIREHAEDRVFGNLGNLKHVKQRRPAVVVGVCGCMAEQAHVADKMKTSYPYVDLIFGPHVLHRLPELLYGVLVQSRKMVLQGQEETEIHEEVPVHREDRSRAWVTVMYGCNNFCTYCVVPYVRGREKSRQPDHILREVEALVQGGCKEITLLGQNVNSYGKGLSPEIDFAGLLAKLDAIEGDFRIRFMTSHPKDASRALFDVMAKSRHIPHAIHLPFQSGSSRVLSAMNRGYTREMYLELVAYAKQVMPDISITSDVIVGFPGETYEEFQQTLSLIREVRYTSLFTFIFSPRVGTPAAALPDPVSHREKTAWMQELLETQEEISRARCAGLLGQSLRVLVEGRNPKTGRLTGRSAGSFMVEFPGADDCIGQFVRVRIQEAKNWLLFGEQQGAEVENAAVRDA